MMQEDMSTLLKFIEDHAKKDANIPRAYWHGLPKTDSIPNNEMIKKYFEGVSLDSQKVLPNMFINLGDTFYSEQVLTKVVIGFLGRSFRVYCLSTSVIAEAVDNKYLAIGDYDNGFDSLSNVKVLALYGFGFEPENDFGKTTTALLKIIEKRFFAGLPTIIASSMTKQQAIAAEFYSPLMLQRLFSNCVVIKST
jgi:hypothetical protein